MKGKLLVSMNHDVSFRGEGNLCLPEQADALRFSNRFDFPTDGGDIDGPRILSGQPQLNGDVSAVSPPGLGERAVQIDRDSRDVGAFGRCQFAEKPRRG